LRLLLDTQRRKTGPYAYAVEVRVLGPLEVWRDGSLVEIGSRRLRSILAQLMLARGRTVSVDRLVEATWGGSPPPRAVATLHSYISNLRGIVEAERRPGEEPRRLVTRAPGYALLLDDITLDADLFASAVAAVRAHLAAGEPDVAHRAAEEALSLWRGPVLADLSDEPFVRDHAVALDELRVAVAEDRVEAAVELGLPSVISDAEQLAAEHPERERPMLLLLTALYSSGRVTEALRRYDRFREQLVEDIGVDPSAELQELHLAMLRGDALGTSNLLIARRAASGERPTGADADGTGVSGSEPDGSRPGNEDQHSFERWRPLLGREHEQSMIAQFLAELARGARWLVWHGEPGIGKTRLAEETATVAADLGYTVAWGRCPEDADAPAYWPVTQVLRSLGQDATAVLADRAGPDLDAPSRRFLVNEGVAGMLAASGRATPLVVAIDDLQWADTATLGLLQFCATHLGDAPVGFVLTVRSGVRRAELDRFLASAARRPGTFAHEVPPLDVPDLQALAEQLTGQPVDTEAAVSLRDRTGGNAFFATELLRLQASERPGAATGALPLTVRQVLSRRLDLLPAATRALLDVGAVAGLEFDVAVVALAAGVSHGDALEGLDPAVAAGLIIPVERSGAFAFAHALVRDAVLADMRMALRTRTHARLAGALLEVHGETEQTTADRAQHLVAAVPLVDPAEARRAARIAAEAAERQLAFVEAAEWWEAVDRLAPPPEERPGVLTALGRSLLLAGRTADGRASVAAAATAARDAGDRVAAARGLVQLRATGGAWPWVHPGEVPSALLELLGAVVDELGVRDVPVRAELLITYAIGLHYHPDRERMLAVVDEAVAVARRVDDDRLLADVLLGACTSIWSVDAVHQMLSMADELLHLDRDAVTPAVEGAARLVRVNALWTLGDFAAADLELGSLRDRGGGLRSLWLSAQVLWAEVALEIARGDVARAQARMAEAVRIHVMSGLYEVGQDTAGQFLIHALEGTLRELDGRFDAALIQPSGRLEMFGLRAVAHGQVEEALAALRRSRRNPPYAYHWLATLALQAWLTSDLAAKDLAPDDREAVTDIARTLLADLAPYRDRMAVLGTFLVLGPVSLWIARLQEVIDGPGAGTEIAATAERQAQAAGLAPFARLAHAVIRGASAGTSA
jgi:DNA-binding SARP family transcriptional activator